MTATEARELMPSNTNNRVRLFIGSLYDSIRESAYGDFDTIVCVYPSDNIAYEAHVLIIEKLHYDGFSVEYEMINKSIKYTISW